MHSYSTLRKIYLDLHYCSHLIAEEIKSNYHHMGPFITMQHNIVRKFPNGLHVQKEYVNIIVQFFQLENFINKCMHSPRTNMIILMHKFFQKHYIVHFWCAELFCSNSTECCLMLYTFNVDLRFGYIRNLHI